MYRTGTVSKPFVGTSKIRQDRCWGLKSGAISHRVRKDSFLGLPLLTIYMNDLPNIPKFGSLESDFDDSRLYLSFSVKDTYSVVQQIKYDILSKIAYWCCYKIVFWSSLTRPSWWCWNPTDTTETTCRLSRLSTWKGSYYSLLCTRPGTSSRLHPLSFDEHITNTVSSC